ncbi:NAD(P)H-dependent flavin oxidoreductase [Noviherbaspirillum sedimenti]|nr:nitronate monooxygenase [Noviherbaspirillum sedimenti]
MFLVSGPELVIEACRAGVIGSFPTLNARTPEILGEWLSRMATASKDCAPFAANMILHKSNTRLEADFEQVLAYQTPIVIASVGRPDKVVERVHGYGGLVLADVASLRHARNAVAAGADGLILLTAGAGGNTGWLNPFAFVAAVREFFDGPIAVAGSISCGRDLRALQVLGADLGYMGTAFLGTTESMAPPEHKEAMLATDADGIVQTDALSGMPANFIRSRLEQARVISPDGSIAGDARTDVFSWKTVWSAGQGVGHVRAIEPTAAIVERLEQELMDCAQPGQGGHESSL